MNRKMQQQDHGRENAARRSRISGVGHTGANDNSIPTIIEVNQQNSNNVDDQNSSSINGLSASRLEGLMQEHSDHDQLPRDDGHAYPNSPPSYYVQYPPQPTVAQTTQQLGEDDNEQNDQHNGQPRAWYTTQNHYRPPPPLQEGESKEEGEDEIVESDILNSDVTSESSGDESYSRRRRRYAGFLFFGICLAISVMIGKFYMLYVYVLVVFGLVAICNVYLFMFVCSYCIMLFMLSSIIFIIFFAINIISHIVHILYEAVVILQNNSDKNGVKPIGVFSDDEEERTVPTNPTLSPSVRIKETIIPEGYIPSTTIPTSQQQSDTPTGETPLPTIPSSPRSTLVPTTIPTRSPTKGIQTCLCTNDGYNCIEPYLVYDTLSICMILLDDNFQFDAITSLNITHPATGTVFEVIYPFKKGNEDDDDVLSFPGNNVEESAISPWATFNMNPTHTSMVVQMDPGGLDIWFDIYIGTAIDIEGIVRLVDVKEEEGEKGVSKDQNELTISSTSRHNNIFLDPVDSYRDEKKKRDIKRQRSIYKNFTMSAEIAEVPTSSPSMMPSGILPGVTPCICDEMNVCLAGDITVSESSNMIRICLVLQEIDDGTTSTSIDLLTYLKLSEGNGFIFEAVTEDGLVVSPLVVIEPNAVGVDMAISVELVPAFFFTSTIIEIDGAVLISLQKSDETTDVTSGSVSWDLSVAAEGSEVLSPSAKPSAYSPYDLVACHCNEENGCLQQDQPLVRSGDAAPELRVCILVKDITTGDIVVPDEAFEIVSLSIEQGATGAVLLLKEEDDEEEEGGTPTTITAYSVSFVEDGTTVITISEKTDIFFLAPPPLPEIVVNGKGTTQVGGDPFTTSFSTELIPLVFQLSTSMPSSYSTNLPSASSRPSHEYWPSSKPSTSASPSQTPTELPVSPSTNPSQSASPTVIPEPGVKACVCDATLVCKEDQTFNAEERDLLVCLLSRPKGVELVSFFIDVFLIVSCYALTDKIVQHFIG